MDLDDLLSALVAGTSSRAGVARKLQARARAAFFRELPPADLENAQLFAAILATELARTEDA